MDGALAVSVIRVSTTSAGMLMLPRRFSSSTAESTRSISLAAFSAVSTAERHLIEGPDEVVHVPVEEAVVHRGTGLPHRRGR